MKLSIEPYFRIIHPASLATRGSSSISSGREWFYLLAYRPGRSSPSNLRPNSMPGPSELGSLPNGIGTEHRSAFIARLRNSSKKNSHRPSQNSRFSLLEPALHRERHHVLNPHRADFARVHPRFRRRTPAILTSHQIRDSNRSIVQSCETITLLAVDQDQ